MSKNQYQLTAEEKEVLNSVEPRDIIDLYHDPRLTINMVVAILCGDEVYAEDDIVTYADHPLMTGSALDYVFFDLKQKYFWLCRSKHVTPRMFHYVLTNVTEYLGDEDSYDSIEACTKALLRNPKCPEKYLMRFIGDQSTPDFAKAALHNPSCDLTLLTSNFSKYPNAIIYNPKCPQHLLVRWVKDNAGEIKRGGKVLPFMAVITHPNFSPDYLLELKNDKSFGLVHKRILASPHYPLSKITKDEMIEHLQFVVRRADCPYSILMQALLATKQELNVTRAVASNPKLNFKLIIACLALKSVFAREDFAASNSIRARLPKALRHFFDL